MSMNQSVHNSKVIFDSNRPNRHWEALENRLAISQRDYVLQDHQVHSHRVAPLLFLNHRWLNCSSNNKRFNSLNQSAMPVNSFVATVSVVSVMVCQVDEISFRASVANSMDQRRKRQACLAVYLVKNYPQNPDFFYLILINFQILGSKGSNRNQQNAPQPFRLHPQDSSRRSKERQPPFGPFPRSKFQVL